MISRNTFVRRMRIAVVVLMLLKTTAVGKDSQENVTTILLNEGDNALSAAVCLGIDSAAGIITVNLDNAKKHLFRMRIEPDRIRRKVEEDGKSVWKDITLPDAIVDFSGLVRYYSRPRASRYTSAQQEDLIKRWHTFPAASRRSIVFEVRQDADGVAFYLNGHYVGCRDSKDKLKSLTLALPNEAEVRNPRSSASYDNPKYLPLDLKSIAKPGVMKDATLSYAPGHQTVKGIPIIVADGAESVDVGVVRQMKGSWALECDEHLSRTALDGMPETAHFSVPQAFYTRAWVLCAVDTAEDREPVITARLTRFARSGRGDAISDTTIVLPRGKHKTAPGVTEAGSAGYETDGKKITVPLYIVEFKLKPGDILDLLSMEADPHASMSQSPYLDFEFLGNLDGLYSQWDRRHKPDSKSTSAVHVFGVTLERSPVQLRLDCGQPGNLYHNDEKPRMFATLTSTRKTNAVFTWRIYDIAGTTVREKSCALDFETVGEKENIVISLDTKVLGWYGIDFVISDETGGEILKHEASFARLGKDTRKAGYDSPYGTWWFAGAHYGVSDKDIAGPMLFKAGLRKTTFGWSKYSEKDMAPWKITLNQLSWRFAPKDMTNKQRAWDEAEERVHEQLARFPHCRSADIFHESYAHYVPPELLDEKPAEDEEAVKQGIERARLGAFAAQFYRERFPDIKLLVGNTSSSMSIIASLLRHGFDTRYIDFIGIEAVGQTGMPEKLWEGATQGIWLAREVARKFGHDLPVTGCYEFTARTDRNLGPQRQAEWIVRDMLLCHAYRFQHINPAIIHDVGNAYHNTLWGSGGLCRRNPLLYPKPAYVAVATLTKVLDQVKPLRRVDTGSTTVYALEFERADGNFVYALWTARGEGLLRLHYPEKTDVTHVDLYGRMRKPPAGSPDNWLDVRCSISPGYVISSEKLESIEIIDREFAPPPPSFRVLDKMDDAQQWLLHEGPETLRRPTQRGLPIRAPGEFELSDVVDGDKGPCLELKLNRRGELPDIVGEYTALRPREPVMIPRRPSTIGLWVKGDSGWGKIIFEIQDSTDAVWRTDGVWHDWPGDLSICHDGWRFMAFPIDGSSQVRNISVGARWTSRSPTKAGTIRFPIKLAGLCVVMNRKALDLTDMKEAKGILRFRNIGVCE